jgi:hypothetical protein
VLDPTNPTPRELENHQCNTNALNTIYNAIDPKVFEQIKDLERAHEVWIRLEETYDGTCNNPGFPITKNPNLKFFSNKTHAW